MKIILVAIILLTMFWGIDDMNKVYAENNIADIRARGVWHRPNSSGKETSLDGICEVLDTFSQAGVNMVFLETFYHGMTIFKTNLIPYYTGFENYSYGVYPDYLTAFASEAASRGIEVHCWVEDFYIGVNEKTMLALYHPEWLMIAQNGSVHQSEGSAYGGYIFLDPANSEVRDYLARFYDELLTKVPSVKGLNLDYIRYPVSSETDDTGFTETAMTQFAQQNSLDFSSNNPDEFIDLINSKGLQSAWKKFRAQNVTTFVSQIFDMVKTNHPDVLISTAIFPDATEAYNTKKQDFSAWLQNGYLDIVTPMVYYYTAAEVGASVAKMVRQCSECFCYVGLYTTYHKQSESELLAQIAASENAGADGFVLFDSSKTFFENNYGEVLRNNFGYDGNPLPHSSAKALLQYLCDTLTKLSETQKEVGIELQNILAELSTLQQLEETTQNLSLQASKISELAEESHDEQVGSILRDVARFLNIRLSRTEARGTSDDDPTNPEPDTPSEPSDEPIAPTEPKGDDNTSESHDNIGAVTAAAIVIVAVAAIAVLLSRRKKR